ncbi:MAG TPA: hypothetical protein VGS80_17390 [Ktedonobacterales bacterium]|nr:hypothetical protein [Ktedonobacterales bacterium]
MASSTRGGYSLTQPITRTKQRLTAWRGWLRQAGIAALRLDTLRLRLVKIGGWVRQYANGFRLHLASRHPVIPVNRSGVC